jgi:hypothetical protein
MKKLTLFLSLFAVLSCNKTEQEPKPLNSNNKFDHFSPNSNIKIANDEWYQRYEELLTSQNVLLHYIQAGILTNEELVSLNSLLTSGNLHIHDFSSYLNNDQMQELENYLITVDEHIANTQFGESYSEQFNSIHVNAVNYWRTHYAYPPTCAQAAALAAVDVLFTGIGMSVTAGIGAGLLSGGGLTGPTIAVGVAGSIVGSLISWGVNMASC